MDVLTITQINEIVHDPIEGPEFGFDYIIDEEGKINVSIENIKMSGIIIRKVNKSGIFKNKLIPIGKSGDYIILDFDTVSDTDSVYNTSIGINKNLKAEVKIDNKSQAIVYFNDKRYPKIFKDLTYAKRFIKKMDKEIKRINKEESIEFDDDDEENNENLELDLIL